MRLRITALAIILIVLSACGGVSAAQGFIQQHTRCPAIYYSSPRWSPDGSRIAFTMSDFLPFKTVYLDMIDVNTFTYKRLTSVYDGVYTPTWSPDGSYLAVSAVRGTDIYVIDATTLDESRIMMGVTTHYMNPDWSPVTASVSF